MSVITPHTQTATARTGVRGAGAQVLAAARMLLVLTVVLGVLYPLGMTAVARLPWWSHRADGSMITSRGQVVGSSLIGQGFVDRKGNPLPQWFQPRPSAAGDGWDGASSGASNLGPSNPGLVSRIARDRRAIAQFNSVPGRPVTVAQVPADAVTMSGSGLDPEISPAYARLQAARVAQARSLNVATVERLVDRHIQGRALGFIGVPAVNVLLLNRDLALAANRA